MKPKLQYIFLIAILLFGFLVRLYKIHNPVADWHSWRQADTASVTRNYVKYGVNLFEPRYDDFSDVSGNGWFNPQGYRFVEFPIFNLLHFLLFKVAPFGTLELWGRLTSVFSALASAVLLFLIVRRRSGPATGLLAAGFYLALPFNVYFTRVILPDPLMVTLFLVAIYLFESKLILPSIILGALAIAVKPIAVFFLLPIYVYAAWTIIPMLLPFGLWRIWSHRHPEGIPASLWLLNGNHIRFKGAFFQWLFGTRIGALILGKWGLWPAVFGLVKSPAYYLVWGLSSLLYLTTFAMGNVHHDYYQIPIIPSVSIFLAVGTVHLFQSETSVFRTLFKRIITVVSILFMLAFAWYDIRGLYQVNNYSIVTAGKAVDRLTPPDSVVIAPYQGDTAFLYQTNRRGFPYVPLPIKDLIDRYNATYYVSVNYDDQTRQVMAKYIVIEQTPEYVVVKLEEPLRPQI